MKLALSLVPAVVGLMLLAGCADGSLSSRDDGKVNTGLTNDTAFHVYNVANALKAKDPTLSTKDAMEQARRQVAADEAASQVQVSSDAYQKQKKAAAEDKFLADLDKSQRSD